MCRFKDKVHASVHQCMISTQSLVAPHNLLCPSVASLPQSLLLVVVAALERGLWTPQGSPGHGAATTTHPCIDERCAEGGEAQEGGGHGKEVEQQHPRHDDRL